MCNKRGHLLSFQTSPITLNPIVWLARAWLCTYPLHSTYFSTPILSSKSIAEVSRETRHPSLERPILVGLGILIFVDSCKVREMSLDIPLLTVASAPAQDDDEEGRYANLGKAS